ncbi:hypothetical protein DAPPUDRAFT_118331 [Daphnia pulex]|uniref:Endonuclease/exonuclease/phosphatase domain-containing protein n=1 Tax=Daphnia pulex TaxID=6669 RepID=E9HVF9_DAPPU|nr:hypothetical protein DAPPUDRAFT_118331 [Daphnia pulex]|eukprot:EFX64271.1 hypothetical protein DAPPUDRAFT_118331 [Daphnia pulex]
MGSESPDVWPRTAEISFGNTEVTRHEFYECFEHDSNESDSIFDAVSRLPGRAICVFRIGFKTVNDHIEFLNKFSAKESVVISGKEDRMLPRWNGIKTGIVNVDMEIHKSIPSYITFGSYKEPIMEAPGDRPDWWRANATVDADKFPELAQWPTTSTVVVLDGAPEDPISKPDGTESSSDTDADAEDTNCVGSSVASKLVKKKKMKQTREFRDQQKQSKKRSRTASSCGSGEVAEEIESGVAQMVELGSPTREVPVSIPGVDINSFPALSGGNDVPPAPISPGVPSIPSTTDQMDNEVVEEMDATEVVSFSNPDEDISFSGGSIQPGQRPLDSQEASHMHTNLGPRQHGTAILVRHGLSAKNILFEPEGRLIAMEVKGLAFVCIYAPSGDQNKSYRDSFLRQTIPAYVAQYKAPAIILGDFNAVDEIDDR